jgi:hypothetical protein
MTTALAERDELEQAIRSLPDQQVRVVLEFVRDLEEEEHVPNAETIKVLKDSEAGRGLLGPYHSLEEMFKDFGIHVDARTHNSV